ncbi:SERBP1 family protein [Megaselia abdita]
MMDNRFGLLFESDDVSDVRETKETVQKKKVQVQPKVAVKQPVKKIVEKQAQQPQKPQNDEKKGLKEEKENRGKKIGEKKFAANGEKIVERKPRENQRYNQRNRNDQQQPRAGKREFDRQSGSDKTGVKAVEKRNGAGAHNWGSAKQDIEMNLEGGPNQNQTKDQQPQNADTDEQTAPAKEESIVEPKVLTLDEYKAQQELKRGAKPQYNIRKAGEGEDLSPQWEKMVALKKASKKTDEEEFEYDPSLYPQRVGRLQRIVDIQFNFNDGRRGGGAGAGPGGRFRNKKPGVGGGNASDGPRGPPREPGNQNTENVKFTRAKREVKREQNAPKVDDVRQFPTLS